MSTNICTITHTQKEALRTYSARLRIHYTMKNITFSAQEDAIERARQLITELSDSRKGCISTQVIQEFCTIALQKSAVPLKQTAYGK